MDIEDDDENDDDKHGDEDDEDDIEDSQGGPNARQPVQCLYFGFFTCP